MGSGKVDGFSSGIITLIHWLRSKLLVFHFWIVIPLRRDLRIYYYVDNRVWTLPCCDVVWFWSDPLRPCFPVGQVKDSVGGDVR